MLSSELTIMICRPHSRSLFSNPESMRTTEGESKRGIMTPVKLLLCAFKFRANSLGV